MILDMAFRDRLRALRLAAGLTQEGLARLAGISTSALSKLEQQDMDPSWSTVQRLAKALNVPVADFIDQDEPPAPPVEEPKKKRGKK
jgi:transcriptional regulator with XRE-family HTH domain